MLHVAFLHMLLCYTHMQAHTTGSKVLAGKWGKRTCQHQQMPCSPFLEGLSLLPLKSVGVLSAVVSLCLAHKRIAILAAFIYHKHWSKRARSLRDMGRGFKPAWSGSAFIHWVYDFTVPPCCCVVACDAVNPTSSTNSLPHVLSRKGSHSRMNFSIVMLQLLWVFSDCCVVMNRELIQMNHPDKNIWIVKIGFQIS